MNAGPVRPIYAAGLEILAEQIRAQGVEVESIDWRPPLADPAELNVVMADFRRVEANALALQRIFATEAYLVDVVPAGPAIGLTPGDFLHAGPPIEWSAASGPLRGALMGAAAWEGLVPSAEQAGQFFERGSAYTLRPCHHLSAVGPMAGVICQSMWVFVVEDPSSGRRAFCSLNEGLGKVLRYGAYGEEVLERLTWMSRVLGPALQAALRRHGPIDLLAILAQMLQMGDEGHNRNRAGTMMFMRELLPDLVATLPAATLGEVVAFIAGNDHFFLNLSMPACKLIMDAGRNVPGSTLVVAMARNGTEFGIQVSGTGDAWFTGPAQAIDALFFPGFGPADANPDIGDSAITETAGLGGFAMAAAPAIVQFVGGQVSSALAASLRMYEIALAEHSMFAIPNLDFRGCPVGIDVTRVVRTGILPQINTGVAGRRAGVGQVGAGLVTPPAEIFPAAVAELARRVPR